MVQNDVQAMESGVWAHMQQRTVAEFFAGIGLMRMGLERSGWQVRFANDFDPQKFAMYCAQFPAANDHFDNSDIYTLPAARVPPVTLATASFPCVDLSLAGPLNGLNGRVLNGVQQGSGTFWAFVRVLAEMLTPPPLVLLENVTGFLTAHNGENLRVALQALNELGYYVDAFIIDAAWFVPQSRRRLFVVGVQASLVDIEGLLPLVRLRESLLRPKSLVDFVWKHPSIQWALRPLPVPTLTAMRLADVLEDIPDDAPEWWSSVRAHKLLSQMSPRHRAVAEAMIAGADWSYGTVFRRMRQVVVESETTPGQKVKQSMAELRTDGVAGCLRTPKGGSAKQILFKAGHGRYAVRLLTAREVARLMGADNYTINVKLDQALFGFGDAVCVPVVDWIATHYLNPLLNEYQCISIAQKATA